MAVLATSALACGFSQQAQAITINFSSSQKALLTFTGSDDKFAFSNGTDGSDFVVTSVTGGAGTSVGFKGNIGGDYTIGTITTSGAFQSANVTSLLGTFSISDGGFSLTGKVAWIDIYSFGTTGGTNSGGLINLSNLAYSGTNTDLLALKSSPLGIGSLSFQFIPMKNLTALTTDSTNSTSYSGSLGNRVPDGGSTLALLGGVLVGAAGLRRKLSIF